MGAREARSTEHCQTGRAQAYVLFYAPAAPRLVLACRAMKHYHSIRYAFVWCEQLASCDIKMGTPDSSMQSLYREYAAAAQYLGRVRKKFEPEGDVIQPIEFATWVEIFCRVFDEEGEWPAFWLDSDFDLRVPWLH